ncbi:RagB/SusD family nutrient uptake outer membrane protein [Prevotella sp. A2931]|uniref:RagB/SusD family nutrient uptake outer membrane protein n=1 Tax=Prevotella illustrans TaxID=2800387 RepID=A0ABS3M8B4_9BACT|nr:MULTISPECIES: RagB/SusD family nutrient uptake outer membrane protein [Prevotella]MBO1364419.1 RagB/SusD family nutrient uptake outer membrane protein [Prevotella illustrans]PTL26308.1 RagB/SusD family nutrient uptake outer membrane protein [Prevotella sp. oral taxon 820]
MKLKQYIYCVALAAVTLTTTACNDFLDKDPENRVPEEDVDYTATENMYMPVSGVYAKIRTGAMHWVILPLSIVRDDDMWSGRTDDQQLLVSFGNYQYDNTFWGLNEMWNQYYGIIKVANAALTSLDGYAANTNDAALLATNRAYQGEVRTLRAFAYYRLTQAFGDVTILRSNSQNDLTRSTKKLVEDYMLEDLRYAMENNKKLRPNEMEHMGAVTAYTAEMMAAKIYLNRGDYAQVEKLTDDIINSKKFTLYSDFYNLFKIPGKLCDESLFECQCTDFGQATGDMVDAGQWFVFQGPGSMGGWNFIRYYADFKQWAEQRGETVRATTTFLQGGGTVTPSGDNIKDGTANDFFNGKVYTPKNQMTPGRTKYGTGNNVRIFRYADVLLMNAEAKVRQGKNGDVPFNEVRQRAKMVSLSSVTIDQILDERRMELAGEWGERYADLVRTGKAAGVLSAAGWTTDKTYYPLPFTQLSNVPALKNEPLQ